MEIAEMMKKKRPVKKFKQVPLPDEKLNAVLNSMRVAPSAANCQPWKFIVVRQDALKQKLSSACQNQKFLTDASALVIGCATIAEGYPYLGMYMSSYPLDMGSAMAFGLLAAGSEGISAQLVHQFHNEKVQELLNIPVGDVNVCFILALGYSDEDGEPEGHKNLSEIVRYEKFE